MSRINIGLVFANTGPFAKPDGAKLLARAAEEFSVESLWTVEHVVIPEGYTASYPYSSDGKIPAPEHMAIPDPLSWLAFVAAITENVKLATGILILPQRHPLYVAKELATLDQLSKGRIICGIGIGWLHEEFEALGIPFNERVGRTEESVAALRSLWKPGAQEFRGEYYSWGPCHSNPIPAQADGVPIHVGGHVKGAARRAGRIGNGFFPAQNSNIDAVKILLDEMRAECQKVGRDPSQIELSTTPDLSDLDHMKALVDLGFTRFLTAPPAWDEDGLRKGLEGLAKLAESL